MDATTKQPVAFNPSIPLTCEVLSPEDWIHPKDWTSRVPVGASQGIRITTGDALFRFIPTPALKKKLQGTSSKNSARILVFSALNGMWFKDELRSEIDQSIVFLGIAGNDVDSVKIMKGNALIDVNIGGSGYTYNVSSEIFQPDQILQYAIPDYTSDDTLAEYRKKHILVDTITAGVVIPYLTTAATTGQEILRSILQYRTSSGSVQLDDAKDKILALADIINPASGNGGGFDVLNNDMKTKIQLAITEGESSQDADAARYAKDANEIVAILNEHMLRSSKMSIRNLYRSAPGAILLYI